MAAQRRSIESVLVGRTSELESVTSFLEEADDGKAGVLIVTGDAGVGKTSLVALACSMLPPEAIILQGACLRLASLTVPLLAVRSAFRGVDPARCVPIPPFLEPGSPMADVPILLDGLLESLASDRLVVLVIDDLHWADQSTLDVLMYLTAGPSSRRVAVVCTIRSGEIDEGHPLRRWIADIRRMPGVSWLTLGALDFHATGEQLNHLLRSPPHLSLTQDVFSRSRGNPLLTSLIAIGLDADTRELPADYSADLSGAVLQSWSQLTLTTRDLLRVLAIGGTPITVDDLQLVRDAEPPTGETAAAFREATDAGTLDMHYDGTYWFRHPLTAEVLEKSSDAGERRRWHRAFAAFHERSLAFGQSRSVETLVAIADHRFSAGDPDAAFQWALRASDAADRVGGRTETLRLLRRAVVLRHDVTSPSETERELLARVTRAAAATGDYEVELEAIEAILSDLDVGTEPLLAAELLVRRMHLRFSTGRGFLSVEDMRHAVRLSSVVPESWQHALALAELAHAGLWQDDPSLSDHAERSLELARRAGSPRALSYALTAKAITAVIHELGAEGRQSASQAIEAAVRARDFWAFCHATFWECNAIDTWCSRSYAEHLEQRRVQLTELKAPHPYVAWLSAAEASSWLSVGGWRACGERIRVALASDPGPAADVAARLSAARLAALQGRTVEALAHLARADELFAEKSAFLSLDFDAVRAEILLADGNADAAYDAAIAGATSAGIPPTMCEWLIPLAARALADMVGRARDNGVDVDEPLRRLTQLECRFPEIIRDFGPQTEMVDRQVEALGLMYAAEAGRARRHFSNGREWLAAADACRRADLPWEGAYSCRRAAEALLIDVPPQRELAASVIRRGMALAEDLRALPIVEALARLAATARIRIEQVTAVDVRRDVGAAFPQLTIREQEILDHLVAGRTYREIAHALVVSEKTVSSHVSNMLRKTGTGNRVELSGLAMRRSVVGAGARTIR